MITLSETFPKEAFNKAMKIVHREAQSRSILSCKYFPEVQHEISKGMPLILICRMTYKQGDRKKKYQINNWWQIQSFVDETKEFCITLYATDLGFSEVREERNKLLGINCDAAKTIAASVMKDLTRFEHADQGQFDSRTADQEPR